MYEQEKKRAVHLMILLCYTIATIVLTGESLLLGWDMGAVMLLLVGLGASWAIHIMGKIPASISLWLYCILTLLAFFFYGIHETSMYDLAPVMIVIIVMYSSTEMRSIINLCVGTYYLTMCYDFVFVLGGSMELTPLSITRILLHLLLVYMAGRLAKLEIQRRSKERKNADERIAELEETNRRTEDFLTNVSHELRTPINAVTGITAVMLKNEDDADKRKDIMAVQNAGRRLFHQIEDILDYTEIDTGRIEVSEDVYMISSIVNDIITEDRLLERRDALELIFDIDASMPSGLIGDGKKIKKIIKHLIDNALKFTKKGGVYVRIYALHKSYGVNLCIRISDTGIGIAEEEVRKIKERFYQSNGGRNRRAGGLGLGLPIVYGMVAAMEGFLQVESSVESGTTVSVSIPQKVSDNTPSMVVEKRKVLCLACFLRPEKYEVPEVRDYYNEMISHMVRELDISLHRVSDMDELKKLISMYQLTHLFIGKEEYGENKTYFEHLEQSIEVIVVADDRFVLPQGSRIRILRKPFYCLSIVNMLNAKTLGNRDASLESRMICPEVKVLVVDDEPMNLSVAEGIFRDYQMNVTTTESGREAIALCEREAFDLIFLDHMMPEMDGVETLKRLRKIYKDSSRAPMVIAFTANAVSGAREMFLKEGFDEFVSKPIEYPELERVLKKVLPKSSIEFVDENYRKRNTVECIEKKGTKEDEIILLENAGINTRAGIEYCRGDIEFYLELLNKFAQDAARKEIEINDFFKKEDFENYRIRVHALKSTAKMVGADSLSEMARHAEDAAQNHDAVYIRENHEELLTKYHEMVQQILDVLNSSEDVSMQIVGENSEEMSGDDLIRQLEELRDSLNTFEADKAEALISKMSGSVYQGTSIGELLHEVVQDVEDFELGAASEKVGILISSIERGKAR